jgi:hypothetical protein
VVAFLFRPLRRLIDHSQSPTLCQLPRRGIVLRNYVAKEVVGLAVLRPIKSLCTPRTLANLLACIMTNYSRGARLNNMGASNI